MSIDCAPVIDEIDELISDVGLDEEVQHGGGETVRAAARGRYGYHVMQAIARLKNDVVFIALLFLY